MCASGHALSGCNPSKSSSTDSFGLGCSTSSGIGIGRRRTAGSATGSTLPVINWLISPPCDMSRRLRSRDWQQVLARLLVSCGSLLPWCSHSAAHYVICGRACTALVRVVFVRFQRSFQCSDVERSFSSPVDVVRAVQRVVQCFAIVIGDAWLDLLSKARGPGLLFE